MTVDRPVTVVFVPGAWHGAWCFDPVLARLTAAGVSAIALDLPGRGADRGELTDLHGDADRVRQVLDAIPGDVLLVGHSYGGAVITEAGVHPAVRHLVYLAAHVLREDESCMAAALEEATVISHDGRPDLGAHLVIHPDGVSTLDEGVAPLFYGDCPPAAVDWAMGQLGPQLMASLAQQPEAVAWRERPSTYVVCEQDQAIHPDLQRILARRCTNAVAWPTGHSPFLSQPQLVADLVRDLLVGIAADRA